MASVFEFVAESRGRSGTSAARAVRRQGKIPAVVYGGHADPVLLSLNHNDVLKHLNHDAVYSHVLDLNIDGKGEKVLLKTLQRHPAKPLVLHMDFLRINMREEIRVSIPLHFKGEEVCPGIKEGGMLMPLVMDVEVACLPGDLPEFIEIDISALQIGDLVNLNDLTPPSNVQFVALLSAEELVELPLVKIAQRSVQDVDSAGDAEEGEVGQIDSEDADESSDKE